MATAPGPSTSSDAQASGPTTRSKKRARSVAWDHFGTDDADPDKAVCIHCQMKVKHSNNTSNLFKVLILHIKKRLSITISHNCTAFKGSAPCHP